MLLDNKRKKLFDDAYTEYLSVTKVIEELFNDAVANPFDDERPSVTDVVCSLDLYLQGVLLKIAMADGSPSPEEIEFIMSLPDELDEVCARNRGYRRFLRNISAESYKEKADQYFADFANPLFLKLIKEEDQGAVEDVVNAIERLFNSFAAVDDTFSEAENQVITQAIAGLRGTTQSRRKETAKRSTITAKSPVVMPDMMSGEEMELAMAELNNLIGLAGVKQEVLASINLLKINNMRKEKGLPELQTSRHMVFTGQPGTGKTTVARIMAKIYKALGVVSKGHLVETDRSGMVAGYVGQTALKTAQVIKKAKGGVLFVDEAYALSSEDGSNDFGKEAIDTIVKGMEDYRDDLVVIVAGYTNEMKEFIDMNPGLRSRFNKYINFDNYAADEMLEIFKGQCEKAQFILDDGAKNKALEYFEQHQGNEQFGNARGVRNYFDRVVTAQATRILTMNNPSETEFRTILAEDVE